MNPSDRSQIQDDAVEAPTYERPLITDQGSLTELTLASGSSYSDGGGFGGGGGGGS